MLSSHLLIGQVLRPQGVKGQVKVRPETDCPERFGGAGNGVFTAGRSLSARIRGGCERPGGRRMPAAWTGPRIGTRRKSSAQLVVQPTSPGKTPARWRKTKPSSADLIGCRALDRKGANELGVVRDILPPGGNDVYVIKTPKGEMLLPALRFVTPQVHPEEGYILVDRRHRVPQVARLRFGNRPVRCLRKRRMTIDILTIFPEMFQGVLNASILGRARAKGLLTIEATDIRP